MQASMVTLSFHSKKATDRAFTYDDPVNIWKSKDEKVQCMDRIINLMYICKVVVNIL